MNLNLFQTEADIDFALEKGAFLSLDDIRKVPGCLQKIRAGIRLGIYKLIKNGKKGIVVLAEKLLIED